MKRPARHARVAEWRKFAVSQGMPAKVAAETTKRALLDMFGTAKPVDEPTPATSDMGPVEAGAVRDLTTAGVYGSALALSAQTMARHVDQAESAAAAAVAGREMRMALAMAYTLGKPLSPHSGQDKDGDDGDGVVVGADRLNKARERSANARKGATR